MSIKLHTPESDALFKRCKQLEEERDEARAAYENETASTLEMAKRILTLENQCKRYAEREDSIRYLQSRNSELESAAKFWRNKHSELFMQVNPIEPINES